MERVNRYVAYQGRNKKSINVHWSIHVNGRREKSNTTRVRAPFTRINNHITPLYMSIAVRTATLQKRRNTIAIYPLPQQSNTPRLQSANITDPKPAPRTRHSLDLQTQHALSPSRISYIISITPSPPPQPSAHRTLYGKTRVTHKSRPEETYVSLHSRRSHPKIRQETKYHRYSHSSPAAISSASQRAGNLFLGFFSVGKRGGLRRWWRECGENDAVRDGGGEYFLWNGFCVGSGWSGVGEVLDLGLRRGLWVCGR